VCVVEGCMCALRMRFSAAPGGRTCVVSIRSMKSNTKIASRQKSLLTSIESAGVLTFVPLKDRRFLSLLGLVQ
jgi:hypothetical protein